MFKKILAATVILSLTAPMTSAGPIQSVCSQTKKGARTPGLCGCIQKSADKTLSRSDQRRAASLMRDAERAQQVKTSDRSADEAFWKRYRNFAKTAENLCRG